MRLRAAPASLPPAGLPGLDPAWSRLVTAADADGVDRTWHVLDNGAEPATGTVLCVHGNPTWSYLWRRFLAGAPAGWRVVAVDQLGMGFSERLDAPRPLARRIDDLSALTAALGVTGPVVTAGHDWGGAVSLGWAVAHRDQLRGVVLANTAVHQPADSAAPALIRLARHPLLRGPSCAATPAFVRITGRLSRPALPADVRDALAAPYRTPARRRAVSDFVADIPLEPEHVSHAALEQLKADLPALRDVPALLLWGPRDPVFSDRYLRDLLARLPHADVHRYEGASHLVTEDAPRTASDAWAWISRLSGADTDPGTPPAPADADPDRPLWAGLQDRAGDPAPAVVELGRRTRTVSFGHSSGAGLRDAFVALARTAGLREATARRVAPPDCAVLVGVGEPERDLVDEWTRAGTPYLLVRLTEGRAVVGPFVQPGSTACLRCVDAHCTDADPAWPLLVRQYAAASAHDRADGAPEPVDPLLASLALAWAASDLASYVDGGRPSSWSATVTVHPQLSRLETRGWLRHPGCGCSWA